MKTASLSAAAIQDLAARISCRTVGQGPPILFVHGWPLSHHSFDGLVERLEDDYTCYLIDLPGTGSSPLPESAFETFIDFSAIVEAFIEQHELTDLTLVGQDSGGTMARIVASHLPHRISRIVLLNTEVPGELPWLVQFLQLVAKLPGSTTLMKGLLGWPWFAKSALAFGGSFFDRSLLDGPFYDRTILPLQQCPHSALRVLRNADLSIVDELEKLHTTIRCPVLCVWGADDGYFPLSSARQMASRWPSAHLVAIEQAKLLVHEEHPALVASQMRDFFARASAPMLERSA